MTSVESPSSSERGPYRIARVAELTGVPEPTLRAWERRYEIPVPQRTASGYRLYGEREVEQVRRMRALCESGVAAAEAAKLVAKQRRGPSAGRERRDALPAAASALWSAIEGFDVTAIDREVRRLPYAGAPLDIVDEVVVPVLRKVGEAWCAGELSVAQEHLVSQKLEAMLHDFLRLAASSDRVALVACFADDQHQLGALATSVRLAAFGAQPIFLGARTPADGVRAAVRSLHPDLVALSVTVAPERERARELVTAYASACAGTPWVVGGAGAADIADFVRADGGAVVRDTRELEAWVGAAKKRRRRSA